MFGAKLLLPCALCFAPAMAHAQDASPTHLERLPLPDQRTRAAPRPSNLQGVTWAASVAGRAYRFDGDRLRLPAQTEGWENDIDLGLGFYSPMGERGQLGMGVGMNSDEDGAVMGRFVTRW